MMKIVCVIGFLLIISYQVCAQWQPLNSPVLSVNDMLKLSNETILIGTSDGLFLSNDNFLSWDSTSITNNVNLIQKDNLGNIYASVLAGVYNPPGYFFRSTDLGLTWTIPYELIPDNPHNVLNIFINDSGYVFTIQRHGGPGDTYTPVLKSTDFGSSWSLLYDFFCACEQNALGGSIIENVTGTLFVSYLFVIYPQYWLGYAIEKKVPGGNWTLYAYKFTSNMYVYNNELYMATTSFYTSSLGLIKSSDDGNTFVQLNNGFSDLDVGQLILTPEVFIALNEDGIYRSLDEGDNWVRLDHSGLNGTINRIYLDDSQTLYACTNNGIYIFTGVLPVELTLFTALYKSPDVVLTWSTATELNNHGFEIERSFDKESWATIGFRKGKGTTSQPQNYNFSNDISEVSVLKLYYRLKQIDFDGTFENSNTVEVEINSPTKFSLEQNYPNPFNPSTNIQYAISSSQFVTLKVYDVLGKEVATLVNEEKPAGNYEIEFNSVETLHATSLPSGVYFYQLKAGDYIETKKMVLMK
jgi:photosystem II stability/assembly factor-like uncharacterized protein